MKVNSLITVELTGEEAEDLVTILNYSHLNEAGPKALLSKCEGTSERLFNALCGCGVYVRGG